MKRYTSPPTWLQRLRRKAQAAYGPLLPAGMILPPDRRFDPAVCEMLHLPDRNVFRHLRALQIPPTAFVAGAGPRGLSGIGRIPPDAITIALNGAIRYERAFTYWLAFDCAIRNYTWWPSFIVHEDTRNVFGVTLVAEHWGTDEHTHGRIVPHYSFRFRPTMSPQFQVERRSNRGHTSMLIPGILRGGASIAGAAFQFAAFAGARRIVLCGVDMHGNNHWDGYINKGMQPNADWPICLKLNWLVESFRQFQKIDTVSLTPTSIKGVKVI